MLTLPLQYQNCRELRILDAGALAHLAHDFTSDSLYPRTLVTHH